MPRRFVRSSKFRHVFGDVYKKTSCYDNIDISKNSWDGGSYCAVNSKYIAIALESHGGGSFLVLPLEKNGRLEANTPKVCGHKGKVLDLQFNPFNENVIASAAEDSRIKVWKIPEDGLKSDLTESAIDLIGHRKKVGLIQWHPTANNILASAGSDNDVIIWDVEKGSPVHVISVHTDAINCLKWNKTGSLLATTCKDKMVRIIDPRKNEVLHEFKAQDGAKPCRVEFIDNDRVVTVGCGKDSGREIALWKLSALDEPLIRHELDQGSGNMLVMYDDALSILYIAAKGDCSIRYFEITDEDPYIHYLSQYSGSLPQRGFGVLPKRALDVNKCEIFRLYKLTSKNICEPISMIAPRRSDHFQSDIYPNVPGDNPALTSEQWFEGENASPVLISMEEGFVPTEKEFKVDTQAQEDNLFNVNLQTAPKREEDLRKAFYQQQDELQKLKETLKGKELRIRQLEYENASLKKTNVTYDDIVKNDIKREEIQKISGMIGEDSDCSEVSSDQDAPTVDSSKDAVVDEPSPSIVEVA